MAEAKGTHSYVFTQITVEYYCTALVSEYHDNFSYMICDILSLL